jgi:hypothetical protein
MYRPQSCPFSESMLQRGSSCDCPLTKANAEDNLEGTVVKPSCVLSRPSPLEAAGEPRPSSRLQRPVLHLMPAYGYRVRQRATGFRQNGQEQLKEHRPMWRPRLHLFLLLCQAGVHVCCDVMGFTVSWRGRDMFTESGFLHRQTAAQWIAQVGIKLT